MVYVGELEHILEIRYSISAQAASNFIVYSCVTSPLACMPITGYFLILHVSAYDLRIAR